MKIKKILNILNSASGSKFFARKWNIVNDQWTTYYDIGYENMHTIEVLKCNLCDNNGAWILVSVDITVVVSPAIQVALKNCVPFAKCITKIYGTATDDAQDLDLAMSMYNMLFWQSR